MELNEKQTQLLEFIKQKHAAQKRKYTGEPYWNHVLSVAEIVSKHEDNCIEVALCHDLFEDTDCNFDSLYKKLTQIGYADRNAYDICTYVKELTDKFTHEDYPYYNREKRKKLEALRLSETSYIAQTVKYADLIDNTSSIVEHDAGFAVKYLKEKEDILSVMIHGNKELYKLCVNQLNEANKKLK